MAHSDDILVVNDRSLDAQETLIALEQAAPTARVVHLDGGAEALQYLFSVGTFAGRTRAMPHLILLSLEMSGLSGLCVLDVIRAHPLTRNIPVVLLSIEAQVRKHKHYDAFDADAYITRPCDFQRYCAIIDGCVRHWVPAAHRRSTWHRVAARPRFDCAELVH